MNRTGHYKRGYITKLESTFNGFYSMQNAKNNYMQIITLGVDDLSMQIVREVVAV